MRKIAIIAATICLSLFSLTGCNAGIKETTVEDYWTVAERAESLEVYVKGSTNLSTEVLKKEALDAESTFNEKFKATALLCMKDYQADLESNSIYESMPDEMFSWDYPESRDLANECLKMVTTDGEAFWNAMEETFSPYDCLLPMFAAADSLDGETLAALLKDVPESAPYKDELKEAIDKWVSTYPEKMPEIRDSLTEVGYYEDWSSLDWKENYFYGYDKSYEVTTDGINEALAYMDYQRTSLLPDLQKQFGNEDFQTKSTMDESWFYNTSTNINMEGKLNLVEDSSSKNTAKAPETVGKKVLAFYQNLQKEEFKGSPFPLQILGDFMFMLPEEEFPKTAEEIDYYLVLTPSYEYGGYYTTGGSDDTKISEVYSSTSIDLYDADTGNFVYHIGNIMENGPETIYTDTSNTSAIYASITSSDILLYLYHNANKPELYTTMLDHTSELESPLDIGKTILIGNWEITYHSGEIVKEFVSGHYKYTADNGCQFVRGQFTVKNRGTEEECFLPHVSIDKKQLTMAVTDSKYEQLYYTVEATMDNSSLISTDLDAGESKKGTLIFEVPDEVVKEDSLFIMVKLGNQVVYYPVQ